MINLARELEPQWKSGHCPTLVQHKFQTEMDFKLLKKQGLTTTKQM
jgi:hypothetical protein